MKEQIVRQRQFKNIRLQSEDVAEFDYQPVACRNRYRMVVVRKNLSIEKGEQRLFDEVRYFFYLTNVPGGRTMSASQIVFDANAPRGRCNQENLIAQLKDVRALHAPVDNLVSNWAYMVMASLAWTLKAWFALSLPESPRHRGKHQAEKRTLLRMEFRTFINRFMNVPCQIVKAGRRIVYRLLAWNPWQDMFLCVTSTDCAAAPCAGERQHSAPEYGRSGHLKIFNPKGPAPCSPQPAAHPTPPGRPGSNCAPKSPVRRPTNPLRVRLFKV